LPRGFSVSPASDGGSSLLSFSCELMLLAHCCKEPCPCGFYGEAQKPCTCAHALVTKYKKRISGPLLDRIDIHIEVPRVDYEKLNNDRVGESSTSIRSGSRPRARDNTSDSRKMARLIWYAMPICAWGRSGSIASCRLRVKA
jgi:predicted ATPase with chaperone activity